MRKISFHKWQEKKGEAGKKFIKVVAENNYDLLVVKSVFKDVPSHDINHLTIAIFRKTFDFVYPVFKR